MAPANKTTSGNIDEEKLAHAMVSRGLVSREDYQEFKNGQDLAGVAPEDIVKRLVKAGLLTPHQGKRVFGELASLMNQTIPGYQLLEKLGQGSMGTVYKARQLSMDRLVAVKVLSAKLASNKSFLERFQREAHLAARFSSNNVVQAIDVGSAGNINFFIMEYVEGTTIKDELEKGKIYEEKEAVEIVLQIAQAMEHAHRRNLLHRDIKPANIILTKEGIAKLADLGLARTTTDLTLARSEKGLAIGTPYYMAPEQVRGREDIDSRADLYSLGATFYHMVTGQPPFPYKKVDEALRAHLDEELTPPDHLNQKLSSGLGEVIEFMMAKKRDDRYPSPEMLISDLEYLLDEEAPKYARQRMETSSLQDLAEGEVEEDQAESSPAAGVPMAWIYGLGTALALSLLGNLVLFLRH